MHKSVMQKKKPIPRLRLATPFTCTPVQTFHDRTSQWKLESRHWSLHDHPESRTSSGKSEKWDKGKHDRASGDCSVADRACYRDSLCLPVERDTRASRPREWRNKEGTRSSFEAYDTRGTTHRVLFVEIRHVARKRDLTVVSSKCLPPCHQSSAPPQGNGRKGWANLWQLLVRKIQYVFWDIADLIVRTLHSFGSGTVLWGAMNRIKNTKLFTRDACAYSVCSRNCIPPLF